MFYLESLLLDKKDKNIKLNIKICKIIIIKFSNILKYNFIILRYFLIYIIFNYNNNYYMMFYWRLRVNVSGKLCLFVKIKF